MFLKSLTTAEQQAFIALAHRVAQADGVLVDAEAAMMRAYQEELGITLQPEVMALEDAIAAFGSESSRRRAFMELIGVALADGHHHAAEVALLSHVQTAFGIDDATAGRFTDWVHRLAALYAEGESLLEAAPVAR
ncbi:Tellurite resistance protein TerB [compost metagenome]